jgi:UDP-N-acetylmuramoyl-L-alanyl-D-glutamate--2,6-diaminopimelate ligase
MDNYFEAKLKIFNYLNNGVNLIIPSEQLNLFKKIGEKKINIEMAQEIKEELPVFFSTTYNKNNLEVAKMLVEKVFDIKVPNLFTQLTPPDGRFYIRQFRTCYIVVDFAHTPDALENICLALKKAFPKHELKVLFGCGGDRDRKKRSIMGQIAQQCSDWIYLTSDNPRSEEPLQIIDDIKQGITFDKLEIIPDRRKAVRKALGDLKENQVILLAGKGHENYILTNGVKDPYSDIEEVEKFISGNL